MTFAPLPQKQLFPNNRSAPQNLEALSLSLTKGQCRSLARVTWCFDETLKQTEAWQRSKCTTWPLLRSSRTRLSVCSAIGSTACWLGLHQPKSIWDHTIFSLFRSGLAAKHQSLNLLDSTGCIKITSRGGGRLLVWICQASHVGDHFLGNVFIIHCFLRGTGLKKRHEKPFKYYEI